MVGGPMETQGKLSHQLRCPPGQRATQVPGSARVAEPKEPPRRRLAQQVLRMVGQGAEDYERTPDLLRGRTAVGEGSKSLVKQPFSENRIAILNLLTGACICFTITQCGVPQPSKEWRADNSGKLFPLRLKLLWPFEQGPLLNVAI